MEQQPVTMDDYIKDFPPNVQSKLKELRLLIKKIVPDAQEKISYRMPAFYLNGNLVYFAAHKNHIGFYPTASGISNFKDELSNYKFSKGAVQFPLNEALPKEIIKKIVRFRAEENRKKKSK